MWKCDVLTRYSIRSFCSAGDPPEISRRAQLISVCLVWGSRQATTPPTSSIADTSRMGTAQVLSTRLPKTKFPMMAATRPTPVKKPRAEDLKGARQTAKEQH